MRSTRRPAWLRPRARTTKLSKRDAELIAKYKAAVFDRAKEIDPNSEYGWYELTLGYLIGLGVGIDDAHRLALFIRYKTDLG